MSIGYRGCDAASRVYASNSRVGRIILLALAGALFTWTQVPAAQAQLLSVQRSIFSNKIDKLGGELKDVCTTLEELEKNPSV